MNTETALVVGLVLAMIVIASVFAATTGTIDLVDQSFDDISGEADVPEVTETSYELDEYGGEPPWRKEPRLSQL